MFFIPWRGVPTIPARRSLTGSGRRLAASPVLFREIAVFFLANDGARAIGANAASYGSTRWRNSARFATARRWVCGVLSLRHFRLARWCVLYPLAGGADDSGAAQFDRLGPPAGRVAGSFSRNRRVLFSEVAALFFCVLFREIAVFYKETAIGIGVSSAAKPRSAKRLSKRFVCCCFERRLK